MSNDATTTKDAKLTWESLKTLQATLSNPAYRIPVDMNINKFKKLLGSRDLIISKAERNRLIKQYKAKAWGEYDEIVKGVSSFPTRPVVKNTKKEEENGQSEE